MLAPCAGGLRRAVFVDRDGVINERLPGAYVRSWGEFRFLWGARAGLRLLREAGYLLVAVTNQRGIGRGLMSERDLAEVHRRMQAELARAGAALDDILHCPHDLAARENRQSAQTATSTISSVIGGGIGSRCLARLAR